MDWATLINTLQAFVAKLASIGTIGGIILGWALAQLTSFFKYLYTEKKQAASVRTTLSVEIDRDIELLKTFWDELMQSPVVKNPPPIAPNPEVGKQWHAQRLGGEILKRQFPVWSHLMLESQLSLLSSVLTVEQIKEIHRFHWHLDSITGLRGRLEQLNDEYFDTYREGWRKGSSLDTRAYEWVEAFKAAVVETIEKGNPLETTASKRAVLERAKNALARFLN